MSNSHYIIVESKNGELSLGAAPHPFRIGALIPKVRPDIAGSAPVLYRLEHPSSQLPAVQALMSEAHANDAPPVICAVVETAARGEELHRHLSDAVALKAVGLGYVIFRYYDPRVFEYLPKILKPEQLEALVGPVIRWSYVSDVDGWRAVSFTGKGRDTFIIDEVATQKLFDLVVCRKALALLRELNINVDGDVFNRIQGQMAKAGQYLLSRDDYVSFALHGLLVHPDFDLHPRVQEVVSKGAVAYYTKETQKWSDDDWSSIRDEAEELSAARFSSHSILS